MVVSRFSIDTVLRVSSAARQSFVGCLSCFTIGYHSAFRAVGKNLMMAAELKAMLASEMSLH